MSSNRTSPERYGRISQCLHWLMAFLIIAMLTLGLLMGSIPGEWKPTAIDIHKSIGICLLLLASVRLLWRMLSHQAFSDTLPRWQHVVASVSHAALYGLMVAMPMTGWAMTSAFGKNVSVFGLVTLPDLIEKDRVLGVTLKNLHGTLSYILIGLIVAHIAAALYHHFIRQDNVLRRMLP